MMIHWRDLLNDEKLNELTEYLTLKLLEYKNKRAPKGALFTQRAQFLVFVAQTKVPK